MYSSNKWTQGYISAMVDFQDFISRGFSKEGKISKYLVTHAALLSGADVVILRKMVSGKSLLAAHHMADKVSQSPKGILEEGIPFISQEMDLKDFNSNKSFSLQFPLGQICPTTGFNFHNYISITPTIHGKEKMELILINMDARVKEESFVKAMEAFLNLYAQAGTLSSMKDKNDQHKREVSKIIDSKTQFLGNLSHEIRSPLNGIVCMGSLLSETSLTDDQKDLLNTIQFSADNITRIIEDLIEVTMLTSGKVILKNETFSLIELCRNLVANLNENAASKGLKLGVHIEEGTDSFHGDSVRIGQVLSNLLQNGIKYTLKGEVFLDIRRKENKIEFVVSDTGVGIPEEKQAVIFDEFVQLGNGTDRSIEGRGVGLGLAIVKDQVEVMGGTVSVRSRLGKGSSFIVVFPVTNGKGTKVKESRISSYKSKGDERFLIVDDDEINRLFLRTILERRGALIDEAENGLIAVEKVAKNKYDMILMDISMPVMNGLDATKIIRRDNEQLPILAVTANAFQDDFQRILESGLDDIVLKPVDEGILMDKITNWLGRKNTAKTTLTTEDKEYLHD